MLSEVANAEYRKADSRYAHELVREAQDRFDTEVKEHLITHIVDSMRQDMRQGGPLKPPTGPEAALVFIREQAHKIEGYAEGLKQAAEWLKAKGENYKANQVYRIYLHAREEVTALRGSD